MSALMNILQNQALKRDLCLYINGEGENVVYILIYVDDLLIFSKDKQKIQNVKKLLSVTFKMKDLGEISEYLGINVNYDYKDGKMKLSQEKCIDSLATTCQIQNGKLYSTPMESNLKIEKAEECEPSLKYRNLIGELLHSHTKKKNVKTHGPDHIYLMFLRSLIPNPWSI